MQRIAGWIVVMAAGLAGFLPAGACAGSAELKLAERLDGLLNAGKPAEAAALFADGATAKTLEGTTLSGRGAIAGWLGSLAGLHLASGNRQALEGGRVAWMTSVADDRLRALGVAPLAANADATVTDGLITVFALRYTAESRMKLADASMKEAESIYRKSLTPDAAGAELQAAMPDLAVAAGEVTAAGDRVTSRGKLTGTWTGVYFGVTGTGQPVSVEFLGAARIAGGAVTDAKLIFDAKALYDQMGFIVARPGPVKPALIRKPATATSSPNVSGTVTASSGTPQSPAPASPAKAPAPAR